MLNIIGMPKDELKELSKKTLNAINEAQATGNVTMLLEKATLLKAIWAEWKGKHDEARKILGIKKHQEAQLRLKI